MTANRPDQTMKPCREAFEEWAVTEKLSVERTSVDPDKYVNAVTRASWKGWQAAKADTAEVRSGEIPVVGEANEDYLINKMLVAARLVGSKSNRSNFKAALRAVIPYLRQLEPVSGCQKCDAEMERVKACEHIAEGEEGWEKVRDLCPSTMAVAELRDKYEAAKAPATGQPVELPRLRAALELAGLYPKVINVAHVIDPQNNKEAYRAARGWYVSGWQDCVKQIADNLAANYPPPEREFIDVILNPRRWTQEMNDAWHKAIPDLQGAFNALRAIYEQGRRG